MATLFSDALFAPVRESLEAKFWTRIGDGWFPAEESAADAVPASLHDLPPTEVGVPRCMLGCPSLQGSSIGYCRTHAPQIRARAAQLADFLSAIARNPPATNSEEVAQHERFARGVTGP